MANGCIVILTVAVIFGEPLCALGAPEYNSRPNIIFIVADDAGWNDFSFHGSPQIPTPNIDALALSGVVLNSYYASPLCTPTRGAIMTGKHPIHIKLQHYVILGGTEDGLPLEEKLLPQYLKELGYANHLVGKWHLGHARYAYTPTARGFDSHYGNWLGSQDYYDHFYTDGLGYGYDMHRNITSDFDGGFGSYTTELYTKEAVQIIEHHPKETPLFLQINHIAPHSALGHMPLQAPSSNMDKFEASIKFRPRRMYAAMVDSLDESVGKVVEALETAGLLSNSIIIFTSDNGGAPEGYNKNYGSNWPLRGVKNSLWEGGTRVAGCIWSTSLPQKVSMDHMHVQDWLPTLVEAAGGDVSQLNGVIDGVSQWDAFHFSLNPPRTEFLYNIDDNYNVSAYRSGPWKVIQGNVTSTDLGGAPFAWDGWYGPSGREGEASVHELLPQIVNSQAGKALSRVGVRFNTRKLRRQQDDAIVKCEKPEKFKRCDPYTTPCLINISKDPCEFNNVADEHPLILKKLLDTIETMNKTAVLPIRRYSNPEASPRNWGYGWTNWKDYV